MLDRSRSGTVLDLLSYGESEVARAVKDASPKTLHAIKVRALDFACRPARKNGSKMYLSTATALAAVEVIEGEERELERERRDFKNVSLRYWQILRPREKVAHLAVRIIPVVVAVCVVAWFVFR